MSKRKTETATDRLKAVPLWQWGAICIFAGMLTSVVMGFQPTPSNAVAARSQVLARGLTTGLFVLLGMILMLFDVLRKKPQPQKPSKKHKHESR